MFTPSFLIRRIGLRLVALAFALALVLTPIAGTLSAPTAVAAHDHDICHPVTARVGVTFIDDDGNPVAGFVTITTCEWR